MAGEKLLRPFCQEICPVEVKDGTICCAPTGSPRPVGSAASRSRPYVLRQRLEKLIQLRNETATLFDEIKEEFGKDYRRYERQSFVVDWVPDIVEAVGPLVARGLKVLRMPIRYVDTVKGGFVSESTWSRSISHGGTRYKSTVSLAGRNLAKDAVKAGKTIVEDKFRDEVRERDLGAAAEWLDAVIDWGAPFAAITVKSFFEIGSISFWAGVTVNRMDGKSWRESTTDGAEELRDEVLEKIETQKREALGRIDTRIRELKLEIQRS